MWGWAAASPPYFYHLGLLARIVIAWHFVRISLCFIIIIIIIEIQVKYYVGNFLFSSL